MQKVAQNFKNIKSTGGGPNTEQTFSCTKGAIYLIIGMKSAVESMPVKPVGLPDTSIVEEVLASNIFFIGESLNTAGVERETT